MSPFGQEDASAPVDVAEFSRKGLQESRIAFKIAIDVCNRLGHWCDGVFTLSSTIFGFTDAPDSQQISFPACTSDLIAAVAAVSGWKSWQGQSSKGQDLCLGSFFVGVATNGLCPFLGIILHEATPSARKIIR